MQKSFLVFLSLLLLFCSAAPAMHEILQQRLANLFLPLSDALQTQMDLYRDNFVIQHRGLQWEFQGDFQASCVERKRSLVFTEEVLRVQIRPQRQSSQMLWSGCGGGVEKNLRFQYHGDVYPAPQNISQWLELMRWQNWREGEGFRSLEMGTQRDPAAFRFIWRALSPTGSFQLKILLRDQLLTQIRYLKLSERREQLQFEIRPLEARWDAGKYAVSFDFDYDLRIELLDGLASYFKQARVLSRATFDQELQNSTEIRLRVSLMRHWKDVFAQLPRAEPVVLNRGQSPFVLELERAFLLLQQGDTVRARSILQNSIQKIQENKVIIREVD